jgi:rhomboid family GlyGly-CTERM serine protease
VIVLRQLIAGLRREIGSVTLTTFPWAFFIVAVASTVSILMPSWREALLYNRHGIESGEGWRLWSGNIVHFGWLHYVADTGLWLIIGWFVERTYPMLTRLSIPFMALAVTGAVYFFDPEMIRYAGLSGMNVGYLVLLALLGWQKSWKDWFWPAILGIHVLELILESTWGHGAIEFDTPGIRVATIAHVGGIVFGMALWLWINALRKRASRDA